MLARPNDYCNFRGGWGLSVQTRVAPAGSIPATADSFSVLWCNGSTDVFGTSSRGSNPCGTAILLDTKLY